MVERHEELCPGGDRASVVAKKRVNARGVKGGRKVETMNKAKKIRNTTNVLRTQSGESATQRKSCPSRLWSMSVGRPGNGRQPLDEPYTVHWMRWPLSCESHPPPDEPTPADPPVHF